MREVRYLVVVRVSRVEVWSTRLLWDTCVWLLLAFYTWGYEAVLACDLNMDGYGSKKTS